MLGDNMTVMAALPLQTSPGVGLGGEISPGQFRRKDDRIPQWGYHETKEFISIRAELEKDFTQTKRNKTLWEIIAGKMKEKGFRRSAEQCKCKWKNLVNRYKGKETSELDNGRQCPFFEELDAIFKERERNMDRLLLESEAGARPKEKVRRLKRLLGEKSSEDDSEDEEEEEEEDSENEKIVKRKKRKADKERQKVTADKYRANSMQEVLDDFFQQQRRFEEQWMEALQGREQERRLREQEWREAMEKLEEERILKEQAWHEQEEQRRAREEERAKRRDELFAALINKLIREEGSHL